MRNKMTGWPAFSPWRRTSKTKDGPNSSPYPVMQSSPLHDGVSATAGSRPTALTPPTMVIIAATAKTFFLMDMWYFLFRQVSHAVRATAVGEFLGNGR